MAELPLDIEGCGITKTDDLKQMMRARFMPPEWALFFEIYAGTGYSSSNGRADAAAMNLYPSRGLLVHGFELKVSRGDWLKELKQPAKAETIFGYCDHWWLVVGDRAIVKSGELPEPWGMIAPRGNGLAIIVQAPKLKPTSLDREFIAVLARRANSMVNESVQDRIDAATKQLQEQLSATNTLLDEARRLSNRRLAEEVTAFEAASGINIRSIWHHGADVGKVVKAVLEHGAEKQRFAAEDALRSIESIQKNLRDLLKVLPEKEKASG